jgi:peptidoglycan/xylan/chitin deacetylase (PgdA/CDA1 family)
MKKEIYIMLILAILALIFLVNRIDAKQILISFDGSGYFNMWEDTSLFAKDYNLKYTYFVSAPYFVTEAECKEHPYWALNELKELPYCKIQLDENVNSVLRRRAYIPLIQKEGHEIASHLCGHYDGAKWTYEQWVKEMEFFRWAMSKAGIKKKDIVGIRAPYLAVNEAYFKAMKNDGYLYDSSKGYNKKGIYTADIEIPIRNIDIIYLESGIGNGLVGWTLPFDDAFQTFINEYFIKWITNEEIQKIYFDSLCYDYLRSKLPTQICLHFSQFEGQPYYNAMKRFVIWVEDKNPKYMTYREYAERIKQ